MQENVCCIPFLIATGKSLCLMFIRVSHSKFLFSTFFFNIIPYTILNSRIVLSLVECNIAYIFFISEVLISVHWTQNSTVASLVLYNIYVQCEITNQQHVTHFKFYWDMELIHCEELYADVPKANLSQNA